ncbi:MAG: c-type cytochrome [Planctomycetota bacterium]|nr:c-type cytochrome [Planctomycetota bacterium]
MKKMLIGSIVLTTVLAAIAYAVVPSADAPTPAQVAAARGKYLVTAMGCADCHTPMKLGPNGPEPDLARSFSGHPSELVMPPAPKLPPGPWMATVAATMTAWSGPWGTSFTANLTPDPETGLGKWTADDFVATLKTGRHMGRGREILPPMPIPAVKNLSEEDMRAMFAYLQSVPAVKNLVPDPLPPADAR